MWAGVETGKPDGDRVGTAVALDVLRPEVEARPGAVHQVRRLLAQLVEAPARLRAAPVQPLQEVQPLRKSLVGIRPFT